MEAISYEEIISDLNKRDLALVAVVVRDANSKLSIMQYDSAGNATYISSKVNALQFDEKLKGNMVTVMGTIGPVTRESGDE
tara:strand:- start:543 stop:785 length:243 start_codon:yes stop_codon:yes gene_type:complete